MSWRYEVTFDKMIMMPVLY